MSLVRIESRLSVGNDMGNLSKNISRHEVSCRCGCGSDSIDTETVGMIVDLLRKQIGSAKAIKETLEGATYNVRVTDGKVLEAVIGILRKYVPRDSAADAIAELRAAAGA